MTKQVSLMLLFLSCILLSACTVAEQAPPTVPTQTELTDRSPLTENEVTQEITPTDFTARFEIYTNGTKRVFSEPKYHRQSTDVFIENPDPHRINIKTTGITWDDFFSTLPLSLTKECLVTGTKQTFCNSDAHKLFFYLNDQENPEALDMTIAPDDFLRVEYKAITSS